MSDAARESIFMDSNPTGRPKLDDRLADGGCLAVEASPPSERRPMVRSSARSVIRRNTLMPSPGRNASFWAKQLSSVPQVQVHKSSTHDTLAPHQDLVVPVGKKGDQIGDERGNRQFSCLDEGIGALDAGSTRKSSTPSDT
jgi:hypothetical protein